MRTSIRFSLETPHILVTSISIRYLTQPHPLTKVYLMNAYSQKSSSHSSFFQQKHWGAAQIYHASLFKAKLENVDEAFVA